MLIHFIQHVPFENPGSILEWAQERGHNIQITKIYAGETPPPTNVWDWLIIMGGPMSVHDTSKYGWLENEKQYILKALQEGKTIIGICLGAQLIAEALGARVYQGKEKEIGWFPIHWNINESNQRLLKAFPEQSPVFHWHGETFELPAGATRLASSPVCENQAFIYKSSVLGLQFHLEMQLENIKQLIKHCGEEIVDAPYIQRAEEMQSEEASMESSKNMLFQLLDHFNDLQERVD